jgi:hypothetical protein
MTELDDVMREHMAYIVYIEHRPFSFKDFRSFQVNEKQYTMKHGTFRNKISQMMQNDEVEIHTRSNPNFYTLKGCRFDNGKSMTSNHTEVTNKTVSIQKLIRNPIYQILEVTSFGERAIHNIHLKLNIQDIYAFLVNNQDLKKMIDNRNKGIQLYYNDINKFTIIVTIYPNNTCNIIIGCSENPIVLDFEGINRLTTTLCRIEERLSNLCISSSIHVPNYNSWIITLWHIGRDSISEYSRAMFHCQWNLAEQIILRIYSKTIENKNRVRIEVQYDPTISIEELKKRILEKI